MQWLVLCGIPYRDQGCDTSAASTDPTNQLPTSLTGQAQKATGRLHCSQLQLFESTTGHSPLQLATDRKSLTCVSLLRLPEHTNPSPGTQPRPPCEKALKSVGKVLRTAGPKRAPGAQDVTFPPSWAGADVRRGSRPPPAGNGRARRSPMTPWRALRLASVPQQTASTPRPPGESQCSVG